MSSSSILLCRALSFAIFTVYVFSIYICPLFSLLIHSTVIDCFVKIGFVNYISFIMTLIKITLPPDGCLRFGWLRIHKPSYEMQAIVRYNVQQSMIMMTDLCNWMRIENDLKHFQHVYSAYEGVSLEET